jgi:HK97 family phage portal protein
MSFLGRVMADTTVTFTPATYPITHHWPTTGPGGDVNVTPESALTIPAAYACTVCICEDIAKVPLQIFEYVNHGDSGKRLARNHPLYERLHDQPNDIQTAIEFREMMTAFALNRGLAIAEKRKDPQGQPDQLWPLHPELVRRETSESGRLRYIYSDPMRSGADRTLLPDEVFVLRGRFGRGVLDFARETMRLQLLMTGYAEDAYTKGPRMAGAVSTDKMLDDEVRGALREALDEYAVGGPRQGRPMILEDGMTWQSVGFSMQDAEFLGTMQHNVADICRFYRVPQHKVQELLRSTNNNISQQSVDYVVDSLVAWAVRWEQAIRRDLILNPSRFFAEHNLEGLLRGDFKTPMEGYQIAVLTGWMTPEEVRIKENMNPEPDNSELLRPLNMTTQQGAPQNTTGPQPQRQAALGESGQPNATVLNYLRILVRDGAARVVRKEVATLTALSKKASGEEWRAGVRDFYREHAEFVERILRIPAATAQRYCESRSTRILERGPSAIDDPETVTIADLTETALDKSALLQAGTEPQALLAATTTSADRELLLAAMRKPVYVDVAAPNDVELLAGLEQRDMDNQSAMHQAMQAACAAVATEMRTGMALLVEHLEKQPPIVVSAPPARRRVIDRDKDGRIVGSHEVIG